MFYPFQIIHAINKMWLKFGILYNAQLCWVQGFKPSTSFWSNWSTAVPPTWRLLSCGQRVPDMALEHVAKDAYRC